MAQTYGSVDRPVRLDLWTRIIEVGWGGGGTVIVEVTAPETKFYDVSVTSPADEFFGFDFYSEPSITDEQYKEVFGYEIGITGNDGEVIVETEITDIWIWEGFYIGALGDDENNAEAVANGTALFGYAPNIHLSGQQVKRNQLTPPYGSYLLGDVQEHIHPNGTSQKYYSGYTALSNGPQYDSFGQPFGDFDYSTSESWYWYHVGSRPPSYAAIIRKSYLINFRSGFSKVAELRDFASNLAHPTQWSIKGYPGTTDFNIAEGRMTPIGDDIPPTFQASGSEAGGHDGIIRRFTGRGFIV
jgi:hypothetical protein